MIILEPKTDFWNFQILHFGKVGKKNTDITSESLDYSCIAFLLMCK